MFTLHHRWMSCLTQPTARAEEVHATQLPSVFPARGDREVYIQLGGSDHLPVLLKVTLTEQTTSKKKEPSLNCKKADWSMFLNLTDLLCRELDTDSSKNINTDVQQLTDYILQAAKLAIPRGRRKDYKPYWSNYLQCLHDPWPTHRGQKTT